VKTEPETFAISIIDFFSVIMPGAIVTYLAKSRVEILLGSAFPKSSSDVEGWAVFLFSSYLLGHFIFLLGSQLDDLVYDRIRAATPAQQQKRIANHKKPASRLSKWLAKLLFPKNADLALERVVADKQNHERVADVDDVPVINAFQWAKARLTIQCPAALLEVQRFEADSKFFRSLVVVLLVLILWFSVSALLSNPAAAAGVPSAAYSRLDALLARLSDPRWGLVLLCVVLACLSFWRYIERRFKATQQAYWYVITLDYYPPPRNEKES